ncbi:hypothetical protein AYI68_g3467 [Smittium mucronatum]|uniref:Uncharacterized protein n=1 Tax=Smittium mucronatum TaxID=133383 RepID=A0A1R0GZU0_9FUNG|nr:hypothetical protein AYI68_g3467 [Smittium mucronatum]
MRLVEKLGKNEPIERLREELGINSVFIRTSTTHERAYYKWPTPNKWISDLIKNPTTVKQSTWGTECSRWIEKYCHIGEKRQTFISLGHQKQRKMDNLTRFAFRIQPRAGAAEQNIELKIGKSSNCIRVARLTMPEGISKSPSPLNQCPMGTELI